MGGTVDLVARVIADGLSKRIGHPVVVEARTGASGTTAVALVARSAPNGYGGVGQATLSHASQAQHSLHRSSNKEPLDDPFALYLRRAIGKAMSNREQGKAWKLLMHLDVVGSVALASGYGLSRATIVTDVFESRAEKTVLAQRVDTAREIREKLAKPLLPVEPLPPITAKLANQAPRKSTVVAARDQRKNDWYTQAPGVLAYVTLSPSIASSTHR